LSIFGQWQDCGVGFEVADYENSASRMPKNSILVNHLRKTHIAKP
jgi:hypothetical protein